MTSQNRKNSIIKTTLIMILGASLSLLTGCGGGDGGGNSQPVDNTPNLQFNVPRSMTGNAPTASFTAAVDTGQPCAYTGTEGEDPFQNGYKTTKFLISVVATWSCIADLLIDVSNFVAHDGSIHATDNVRGEAGYKSDDPTHYSVVDDSATQTTVRLYYGYFPEAPPQQGDEAHFYISWNENNNGDITGRLIIDGLGINQDNRKAEDPIKMRMDFTYTGAQQNVDMFMQFDAGNQWADGFRIHLVKDLNANPLQKVYVARGLINMKAQFLPVESITEIPDLHLYAVANQLGDGASLTDVKQMSLPLDLTPGDDIENHLGNYLFDKLDTYYFDDNGDWDYINKTFSSAVYRGGRTTPDTDGTELPFNPSLDMIITALALDTDYFTGDKCAVEGNDCTPLLNAIFADGFGGQEKNQGSDPMDWRSVALATPVYLDSVFPNGVDWNGAFDMVFNP